MPAMFFRILWIFDALAGVVAYYFFFAGVMNNTVTASNFGIWMALLGGLTAILGGSWFLRSKGLAWVGVLLLLVPALLVLFGLVVILLLIISPPVWR
jgi:hypothetical protein